MNVWRTSHEGLADADHFEREYLILRHLVRCGIASLPAVALDDLKRHCWVTPDHHVIFEVLVRLRAVPPTRLRERLAEEATRMGFPDIDWHSLFAPSDDESQEAGSRKDSDWILSLIASLEPIP